MPLGLWQGNCSGKVIVCTIYCLGGLTSSLQVGPPGHVLPCRRQGGGKGCLPAHRGEDCWRRPQNGPCLQPAQVSACSSASSACRQAQARLPQLNLPHWLACTRTEDRRSPTPAALCSVDSGLLAAKPAGCAPAGTASAAVALVMRITQ